VRVQADDERRYVDYVSSRLTWLRKVAFLLCQDWHHADDVAQAAITKLYVHWRTASQADNLDGYVRRIVVHEFLGIKRTAWVSRVDLSGDLPAYLAAPEDDPTTRVAVRRALAEVPPRQRAALVLRYYCELSVEETAAALGCSPGTVKSQTARGLQALRRVLDASETFVEG
jgi:RNA polymerase sigma-70 factor (sigma-E family)